ncbi:MAG: ABC transporter ATP-binding protein [Pseudomonadota bacterium]
MRSNTTIALLTRLWRDYMRQYWRLYLVAVFCMIIVGGMTAAMVRLVEPTLDIAFINKDQRLIITMALAFFLCAVIRGIANFGQSVLLYQIGFKIIESIQNQMFQTLQSADLQFFLRQGTSSQISRFTNDVTQLRLGLAKIFLSFGRDCSVLIFMCWTMISLNREMAFVVLALLPVTVVPIIWIGKQIRRLSRKTQNELSTMTSMLDDALKSIRQTIIYNRQDIEKARARTIFANVFDLSYRAARYSALNYPIMDLIGGAIMGGIILWGGMLILDGELSVGQFMAFFVAIISAYQPLRSLSKLNASLQEGLAATDRVFQLLDAKDLQTSEQEERQLVPTKHGDMAFENVGFSYKDDPQMIVKGISLQFPTKSITAIIGPSGSGKSTIMNLIAKLYEPTPTR